MSTINVEQLLQWKLCTRYCTSQLYGKKVRIIFSISQWEKTMWTRRIGWWMQQVILDGMVLKLCRFYIVEGKSQLPRWNKPTPTIWGRLEKENSWKVMNSLFPNLIDHPHLTFFDQIWFLSSSSFHINVFMVTETMTNVSEILNYISTICGRWLLATFAL